MCVCVVCFSVCMLACVCVLVRGGGGGGGVSVWVGCSVATILLKVYHNNTCYLDMYHDTSRYQHIPK